MSTEEDTELRDLVANTLESNGLLGNIRAQLRASVFLALEDQESVNVKSLANKKLKVFSNSNIGRVVTCLIYEFLEYFNLDFTLSVFEPESDCRGIYFGRNKVASELNIKDNNKTMKQPLILHLLESKLSEIIQASAHTEENVDENDDYSTDDFYDENQEINMTNSDLDKHGTDKTGSKYKEDLADFNQPPSILSGPKVSNTKFKKTDYLEDDANHQISDTEVADFETNDGVSSNEQIGNKARHRTPADDNFFSYSEGSISTRNHIDDETTDCTISYSEPEDSENYFEEVDPP